MAEFKRVFLICKVIKPNGSSSTKLSPRIYRFCRLTWLFSIEVIYKTSINVFISGLMEKSTDEQTTGNNRNELLKLVNSS